MSIFNPFESKIMKARKKALQLYNKGYKNILRH